MSNKCKYIKEDGTACNAYALQGKDYCFTHDPDNAEKRAIARREGGHRHIGVCNATIKIKRGKIKSIMQFVAKTVTEVRDRTILPQEANSIFLGCNTLLKCFELYDIEQKLNRIEKVVLNKEMQ